MTHAKRPQPATDEGVDRKSTVWPCPNPVAREHAAHAPGGVSDKTVEGVGTLSEAFEYVERARGHLYSFHQLVGRADFLVEEAADLLREAGQ